MSARTPHEPVWKNLWITAVHEFLDALRSKRAIVLMILYFVGAMAASNGFIDVLRNVEKELLTTLRVSQTDSVGTVTETIWQTDMFKNIIKEMVRNDDLAEHIVKQSPIAVFYGWLSFTFAPLLMMLISTTRVSEELGTGSARFVLFRSSLFPWCMGKYLGQALLLLPALLMSAAGAWLIGYWKLTLFAPGACAWQLVVFSLKAVVFTWTFLGLATGVSMLTRYPNLATIFGITGMIVLGALGALARFFRTDELPRRLLDFVLWLTPRGYQRDLWWPDLAHQVPAVIMLLLLGLLYMLPGYFWLSREGFLMAFAVQFSGVVKTYGKSRALNGLDLKIPKGSIFGLVGSNGAGKTTMMSVAAGLVKPQRGEVDVLERGAFEAKTHAGMVSLLPQDSGLPYYARVRHLLHYYARLQGLSSREARSAVSEVLTWVNLADRETSRVRALSHGMMRRVTVAQAFLGNPDLVLLDEPMSGLDPVEVQNIRRLISERRGRQTVVVSSHMLFELQHLCDHVAIIEQGRLVRQETMGELTRHSHRVEYRLGHAPDLGWLESLFPDIAFEWDQDKSSLNLTYPEEQFTLDQLNARVLPALLEAKCPVLEIRRGSDLETEYLKTRHSDP